ncbi:MAG: PIN domain-containing protein [Saccharolobus sp.]|uniref:PIN (PilT N terminus) domain n=2 Tax=Saccharolobus shibatae TaxID=2286 RepID=A0A8F5C2D1_9CREN|nr:PIN domain-containing protein [Saccharolobus shibatae]MCH4816405.1 PIN domain-containing protein [Saccharolobus shibatae]QXJ29383.1 PIN (PilT N terminus) domain [Saccharolobus shibatae B12]QXJ32647.1 PIN (PilT N terminus) domain [Saccharolobus shibatae]QXJ35771.1 PIN (PilT N terminus) domain [Saccharolobus shibatae]
MENKRICLDTDVLIDAFRNDIKKFIGYYTTCINLYEFLRGLAFIGKNIDEFKSWIELNLNVVCIDNNSLKTASRIYAELRKKGEIIEDPDLLIASICIANDFSLMTHNKKHFKRLEKYGLKLI